MKVLQIAYYYPPMGGGGVQRSLKFSRYLGDFGVQTTVLAGHDPAYAADATLLAEVPPAVAVHRVEHHALLQRVMAWRARRRRPAVPAPAGAGAAAGAPRTVATRQAWRDRALSVYSSLQFPDDKAGWARRACERARRIVHEEGIDVILSSAPPVSAHLLAHRLSLDCGVPWVADWRDLWTDNPAYAAPAWRRAIDARLERRLLASACGIVAVTATMQRVLQQRAGPACPVALIPNGYDEADFRHASPASGGGDGCVRIVHAGTLYGHQSPQSMLAALDLMLAREPALGARLRLRFVGQVGARFDPMLAQFAQRHPGVLERTGFVAHHAAVGEMLAADLLLLIIGGGAAATGVLSGKVFEYLRSGRPILLVGPPAGDAAALLRAHARCLVAEEGDVAAIAAALAAALRGEVPAPPPTAAPATFERRALTGQLAAFLRQCLRSRDG